MKFSDLINNGFGVVTVMDVCIYERDSYAKNDDCCKISEETDTDAFKPSSWKKTSQSLDTLKISNLNQEGPTKTITGGKYSAPLIRYGKTTTVEMQDALGSALTLSRFFGCELAQGRVSVTDKFPGPFAMEGKTFFVDRQSGNTQEVYIFMPQFYPEAILNLTQDAEGDVAVFDLNGTLIPTTICDENDSTGSTIRKVFYEIRKNSFFKDVTMTTVSSSNYKVPADA